MKTPIADFVSEYCASSAVRLHMPGHKGRGPLGIEKYDITEISGADVLYNPSGIILESENNASHLFSTAHTFYSAEGSTLAIKAMLSIALSARKSDTPPTILAARNVHRAFMNAAALLDFGVEWLASGVSGLYASPVTPKAVRAALSAMPNPPAAVYITSPDYLGNIADIRGIAEVADEYGVPLLVDNAHGAYLAFLEPSMHPIALGAAMCADSAHKTLPVLTGGAYLHISKKFAHFALDARRHLAIFASTSPSYLILESLDLCNKYLSENYRAALAATAKKTAEIKAALAKKGIATVGDEPLKITLNPTEFGYTGTDLAEILRDFSIECELADEDYLVLMLTPENTAAELDALTSAILSLEKRTPITHIHPKITEGKRAMSIRAAMLAPTRTVAVDNAVGCISAAPTVSCPPAIPIAVSGEYITEQTVIALKYYGITHILVVDCK